ncbi:MAG: MnhB domain-containing protein [Thermoleophilaceae bacterium]
MSRRARLVLFAISAAVFGVVLVAGLAGLPDFGHYRGPYGKVLANLGVSQRSATDLVTAVNFDYRAFDTLGEEFILFAAVLGVAIVLRESRGERERASDESGSDHHFPGSSAALGAVGLALIGPTIVLGMYVVTHGALTPGGGFQGGVVLAAALLFAFLAGEYLAMRLVAPHAMVEFGEAAGAAAYALIGVGGLVFATAFFENFIAVGSPGKLLSGGTIPLSNIGVGIEVAGAFVLLWTEFLDQALVIRGGGGE